MLQIKATQGILNGGTFMGNQDILRHCKIRYISNIPERDYIAPAKEKGWYNLSLAQGNDELSLYL
jgi:hypothetical protein